MAIKAGIIILSVVLGALALPAPESEEFSFFQNVDRGSRIVGGTTAAQGSHPHMVALTSGLLLTSFSCGGSVIGLRSVLTAAHCIDAHFSFGSLSSSLRVTVGTNTWRSGGDTYRLSGNATHPNYVSSIIKNDLGILYTSSAIDYTPLVRPVALNFDLIGAGVVAKAAGWGRISATGSLPSSLLELTVSTVEGQQCIDEVREGAINFNIRNVPAVEPHLELCTAHANGIGYGMCRGDSGSALLDVETNRQIGIVSWGLPCALGAPDMFVRVSAFEGWLTQNIRN